MGGLSDLIGGFSTALTPANLLYAFIGVLLGTAIGVLPGIGPAMAIALLLPITYGIDDPVAAFIMFAGIYYGGMYGGSTTSILLNTPGESASVMTAIEGNKMAKRGRAAQALATAAIGSFIAGTIGTLLVALLAPTVVRLAVQLGAPDMFAIMVLAFLAVTSVLGSSRVRGLASLLLGLTIGLIGIDQVSGQQRLTYDIPQLADGIDVIVVAVGLFAVGEALWVAAHLRHGTAGIIHTGRARMGREDWARSWKPWLRGTAIGFPFGAVPAGGAELPTFLSYVTEKRFSKRPEEFGHGAIEGVAGPEATNNASAAGGLVPLLTLGLPTTATAAVLLAAFQQYGIQPGPLLLSNEPELVWGLLASLLIGNAMLLVLNLPLAPMWARLLRIPRPYLYAGILFFASLGAYAVNASTFDLMVLFVIGVIGFAMRRFGLPVMPAIIGVILGPRAEVQMRRALQISDGEISGLFNTTFAVTVYGIVGLLILWPLINRFVIRRRNRPVPVTGSDPATAEEPATETGAALRRSAGAPDHTATAEREDHHNAREDS
ncbi:tripartite tricarboxylate transporter permease [Dactylosporangium roseum]|uniref:Tripartite tricarboxylate transporter permease n=1 Tax=Dactylosporangium roseum TaxID=47989 RepID=A0ABY5YYR2_9ACTN|nr:tripartite tricarboxylate transporter permease [Dactylosporangium roseum]UWZ34372.1 tripartite tricarboxylate transporter permease [Dactylosporangium roseum]